MLPAPPADGGGAVVVGGFGVGDATVVAFFEGADLVPPVLKGGAGVVVLGGVMVVGGVEAGGLELTEWEDLTGGGEEE